MEKIIRAKQEKSRQDEQKGQRMRQINNFLLNFFNWIVIAVVLIILTIGFFMIIKPKYSLVDKYVQLVELEQKGQYSDYELYLSKLQKLQNAYHSIALEDKKKIDIILPEKVEVEEFFPKLEALILKNGFILTSLQISAEEVEDKENKVESKSKKESKKIIEEAEDGLNNLFEEIGKINITMNIIGTDYNGLKKLLSIIESNLRLMDIENISWSQDGNSTNVQLVTYFMK